jgi:16S rRNA (uracil1498-N3)-methyltransferase
VGKSAARLYVSASLAAGGEVALGRAEAHRLRSVLRLEAGAAVALFNERDGEWQARIAELVRDRVLLSLTRRLREAAAEREVALLFAPIKRARLEWLVEKASEFGATLLQPVSSERTQALPLNLARLRAHARAAAEQSERLSLPEIRPPESLSRVLAGWPVERPLLVCDESGEGEPIAAAAARLEGGPLALLVGPEGGFTQRELDAFSELPFVSRVGLGPRVLRAETAALAGLAVLQAIAGDWGRGRRR